MSKFLDETGLSSVINKIKTYIDDNDINIYYVNNFFSNKITVQESCPTKGTLRGFYLCSQTTIIGDDLYIPDVVCQINLLYYNAFCGSDLIDNLNWSYDVPVLKDNSIYVVLNSSQLIYYKDNKFYKLTTDISTIESEISEINSKLSNSTFNYNLASEVSYLTVPSNGLYLVSNSYFGDGKTTCDLIMVHSYKGTKLIDNSCATIETGSNYIKFTASKGTITVYKIMC